MGDLGRDPRIYLLPEYAFEPELEGYLEKTP